VTLAPLQLPPRRPALRHLPGPRPRQDRVDKARACAGEGAAVCVGTRATGFFYSHGQSRVCPERKVWCETQQGRAGLPPETPSNKKQIQSPLLPPQYTDQQLPKMCARVGPTHSRFSLYEPALRADRSHRSKGARSAASPLDQHPHPLETNEMVHRSRHASRAKEVRRTRGRRCGYSMSVCNYQ
jgi:hypothetical protein